MGVCLFPRLTGTLDGPTRYVNPRAYIRVWDRHGYGVRVGCNPARNTTVNNGAPTYGENTALTPCPDPPGGPGWNGPA